MRASALYLAAAAAAISLSSGTPASAMTLRADGILTAMPALDMVETVHCRRVRHVHRHGHELSRGCDVVVRSHRSVRVRPDRYGPSTLQTIQSGTRPVTSGESTRVDSLRRGPDSPTVTGVRPLSSGSTASPTGTSAPLSSSPSGLGGSSTSGSSSSGSSGGSR
jgi:hypothetical protein